MNEVDFYNKWKAHRENGIIKYLTKHVGPLFAIGVVLTSYSAITSHNNIKTIFWFHVSFVFVTLCCYVSNWLSSEKKFSYIEQQNKKTLQ